MSSSQNSNKEPLINKIEKKEKQFSNVVIKNQEENFKNLEIQNKEKAETQEENRNYIQEYRDKGWVKFLFMLGIIGLSLQFYNFNLQGYLKKSIFEEMGINEIQFQMFVSLPGFLGIPLAVMGGILLDKIGYNIGFIIYTGLIVLGSWICYYGVYLVSYEWLLIGRTIFVVGLQLAIGAQSSLLSKWYSGGELTQRNGYYQGTLKISLIWAGITYPRLEESSGDIQYPVLVGALLSTLFFFIGIFAPVLDIKADKQIQMKGTQQQNMEQIQKNTNFQFSQFKKFDKCYWVLTFLFVINIVIATIWIFNIYSLISQKFKLTQVDTGDILSLGNVLGIFSPFIGYYLKKFDNNDKIMIIAQMFAIIQFAYIILMPECQFNCYYRILPVSFIFGVFLGLFTLIQIPSFAQASPAPYMVGMAYGIAYSLKNFGEAVMPLLTAGPMLQNYDPIWSNVLLLGLAVLGLVLSIILYYLKKDKELKKALQKHNY